MSARWPAPGEDWTAWEDRRRAAKTPAQARRELAWILGILVGGSFAYVAVLLVVAQ